MKYEFNVHGRFTYATHQLDESTGTTRHEASDFSSLLILDFVVCQHVDIDCILTTRVDNQDMKQTA
jgi:hypothetical protein